MTDIKNRRFYIRELPKGQLSPNNFEMREEVTASPQEGEVLTKVRYLSLDAASRAWMQGATYRSALTAGSPMAGLSISEVVESASPRFKSGDIVEGDSGWTDYAIMRAREIRKQPKIDPLTHLISLYGVAGRTAWFGMVHLGRPAPGETVVVSAAAGSVGIVAAQLAKAAGANVVGIAGGEEKCHWLENELGIKGVDYKSANFFKALRAACPTGINLYFDNVGGKVLEAALFQMVEHGRIMCCGAVSQYDTATPVGAGGVPGLVVVKRITMRGFIVADHERLYREADARMKSLVEAGQLKVIENVIDGLEQAPQALCGLLAGENIGKRMVKVS